MSIAEVFQQHIDLCEEIYGFILEENGWLKRTGHVPEAAFLDKKRAFLLRLDESLSRIREHASNKAQAIQHRALIEKAQQLVLKIMTLDKENEQVLLKCTMISKPAPVEVRPSMSLLQKIYEKHH